jgi:hypothetical protein
MRWVKLLGFAGKHLSKRLTAKGATILTEPAGFYVESKKGPLRAGEIERARLWARQVAHEAAALPANPPRQAA